MARILIVEDSPTQIQKLRFVLEAEGYHVEAADSAEAAMPLLAESQFDMVISDIVMPGRSGYDLCHYIKTNFRERDIPVALLTSLNDPMDIIRGLESGADNFITKPYEPDQLIARINTILENKQLRLDSKLRLGVEIVFLGKTFTITSDKEQILDLLISTFEDVVRANLGLQESRAELAAAKAEIEAYAQQLEQRVIERTATLAERQRQLAQAQEIAHLGSWRWDVESGDVTWSDEMHRVFGVEQGSVRKFEDVMAAVHEKDRQALREVLDRTIADKSSCRSEFRAVRPDGNSRYCWMEAQCEFDERGKVVALFGVCQDITERRQAEAELRKANELRRTVIESSPLAIFTLNPHGEVTLWNPAAERIFGYGHDEVVGRAHPTVPEEWMDDFRNLFRRVTKGETIRDVNVVRQRKDGKPIEIRLSAVPLHGSDGELEGILSMADDLTEHREMQRQLTQAQKMEAVGQLTGGLAHDFNNLLGIIIGNLDLLQERLKDDPEATELADAAVRASLRGADLTRQLLAFSRRQPLQPKLVDMNGLVGSMTKLLARTLGGNIEIELITASEPALVMADPAQLESALANMAINSRHAMPEGGALTIEIRHVQLDQDYVEMNPEALPGDYVVLEVSDTGTGMPPEILERVFEPFFTTRPANEGTGLGLSQVYGFAKQSNGHIKIYSELGQGTTVRLYLPRADAVVEEESEAAPADEKAAAARNEVILVVEDNAGIRDVLTKHLSQLGYGYLEAENAKAALEILDQAIDIDLLFTDIVMPGGMSGYDLTREAVARRPNLKVLMTSGFPGAALSNSKSFGTEVDLLSKPYRRKELARKLREILDK